MIFTLFYLAMWGIRLAGGHDMTETGCFSSYIYRFSFLVFPCKVLVSTGGGRLLGLQVDYDEYIVIGCFLFRVEPRVVKDLYIKIFLLLPNNKQQQDLEHATDARTSSYGISYFTYIHNSRSLF